MKKYKYLCYCILLIFSVHTVACSSAKFVKLDSPPPSKIKSKGIKIITNDNPVFYFNAFEYQNDTLYGSEERPFLEDLHDPKVRAIPYSSIKSMSYLEKDWLMIGVVIAAAAVITIIAITENANR